MDRVVNQLRVQFGWRQDPTFCGAKEEQELVAARISLFTKVTPSTIH